jgi:hypothetical protein
MYNEWIVTESLQGKSVQTKWQEKPGTSAEMMGLLEAGTGTTVYTMK